MPARPLQPVIQHLRTAAAAADRAGLSDAELLARFASGGDEAAFELLVWRHAGTVLGVCRRVLRHEQDALDAFQATWLALARRARSIGRRESVGGWLYRVAYRAALRARARAAARAGRERPLGNLAPVSGTLGPCAEAGLGELRDALDEEVSRLPQKYRGVFVLRCLAGKSREEAARELACPVGTAESRLARARARLRAALTRRGFAGLAALLPGALAGGAHAGGLPRALVGTTVRAATAFAAGRATAAGAVPVAVAALTKGVLREMSTARLKCWAVGLLVAVATAAAGVATWAPRASARDTAVLQAPERQGVRPAAAGAPKQAGKAAEEDKLQGSWVGVAAFRVEGEELPAEQAKAMRLVISGAKATFRLKGDERRGAFRAYQAGGQRVLDLTAEKGPRLLALYEVNGNTLRLCYGDYNATPPASFDSRGFLVVTLRRAEKR
jgi:RNA polymerase sigma factor (sigma-70 family)